MSSIDFQNFRLIKKTKPSGFTWWVIERRFLFWWGYYDSFMNEETARTSLENLRRGVRETREVVG